MSEPLIEQIYAAAQEQCGPYGADAVIREVYKLERALLLACERIADGPQKYHEANTPDGWAHVFMEAARRGMTPDAVVNELATLPPD